MIILNQDRDMLIAFEQEDILESKARIIDGVFYGINLLLHNECIGTFDTVQEIIIEMQNIINCKYEYYVINGFNDYNNCLI